MYRELLKAALNRYAAIPEAEFHYFEQQLKWKTVEKGEHLLWTGERCDQIFYCASGLFRMYYSVEDGSDCTKEFITEHRFFTSYSSVLLKIPSYQSLQALERSEVAVFTYQTFEQLFERDRCWETLGRKLAEGLFIKKVLKERQLLMNSAEERYQMFLQEYPGIEQRIPQYHIASYLGISPVSLSRIRRGIQSTVEPGGTINDYE
jgi:CRP-like cAMP-binding protein